jgi:hypothetical protein
MAATSNPLVVSRPNSGYNIYWGDIHGHTQLSDGLGKNADYFLEYGKNAADLDVCATTEHGAWEAAQVSARKFNLPGRFVTFWAYEWNSSYPARTDRNIYYYHDDEPVPEEWPDNINEFFAYQEKVFGENKDRRIIVGPHHFTYKSNAPAWYDSWDPRFERFIEIYSEHGMSEYHGNPRMLNNGDCEKTFFAAEGLKRGIKCGFIASSDTHDSHPGRGSNSNRYQGGLVAFLAKNLTRKDIWDAFWNRRVYAVTMDRIYIEFNIDGHCMGEEFSATGKPHIRYRVLGCDNEFEVFLIRNNEPILKSYTNSGSLEESFTDELFTRDSFYYLRVVQKNGECAWASPIWVN